jgi:biopolymer transport protein ExbD
VEVEDPASVPLEQIVIRVDAEGGLFLADHEVSHAAYLEELRPLVARRAQNDKLVFVVADDAANYGVLVDVIEGARAAGAETIAMATQSPERASNPRP